MKNYLLNLLAFCLLLFLVNEYFKHVINEKYIKDYNSVDLSFENYMLSDSHGLPLKKSPEKFGFYNFAAGGESYMDMLRKLKYLIRNAKVKKIVLSVDDHTLSPYYESTNNLGRSIYYSDASDYISNYEYFKNKVIKTNVVLFNTTYSVFLRWYFRNKVSKFSSGTQWSEMDTVKKKESSDTRFRKHFPKKNKSKQLSVALDKIISICKNRNIELIGVKFPLYGPYRDMVKSNSYRADSVFVFHNLAVYDFRDVYEDDDSKFENQDHLTRKAGDAFGLGLFSKIASFKTKMK